MNAASASCIPVETAHPQKHPHRSTGGYRQRLVTLAVALHASLIQGFVFLFDEALL
jgi:hypothetical protein